MRVAYKAVKKNTVGNIMPFVQQILNFAQQILNRLLSMLIVQCLLIIKFLFLYRK